jgi:phosphatidylglycerophosphate synthase
MYLKYRRKFDEKIASNIVKRLSQTSITPNQISTIGLLLAAFAAVFFSFGWYPFSVIASILFILARFCDHLDGELARVKGENTQLGYYFDYFVGTVSYILMFLGLSAGIPDKIFGYIAGFSVENFLTFSAITACLFNTILHFFYKAREKKEFHDYPASEKVDLEDGIYLIGPFTWFGLIDIFFFISTVGSVVYFFYNVKRFFKKT